MEMRPIKVEEVTVDELEYLSQSTSLSHDDTRPVDVCAEALRGKALIWRYRGDEGEEGIMVTQMIRRLGGTELFMYHLAGDGLADNGKFIMEALMKFANEHGCRWITGLATEYAAEWFEKFLGFEKRSVFILKEV